VAVPGEGDGAVACVLCDAAGVLGAAAHPARVAAASAAAAHRGSLRRSGVARRLDVNPDHRRVFLQALCQPGELGVSRVVHSVNNVIQIV
jgi:hypothetical protein